VLYIQEENYDRQLDLLRFLAGHGGFQVCAWLYPESQQGTLAGFRVVASEGVQPVTSYNNGTSPSRTELVAATDEAMAAIRRCESEMKANCDSIALYPEGGSEWCAATIGHEGMCIVHDESNLQQLQDAGFKVSNKPPAWW
jgi:hypothetical protein